MKNKIKIKIYQSIQTINNKINLKIISSINADNLLLRNAFTLIMSLKVKCVEIRIEFSTVQSPIKLYFILHFVKEIDDFRKVKNA